MPTQAFSSGSTQLNVCDSPAVANGVVYVGSDARNVDALNAEHRRRCCGTYETASHSGIDDAPAVANGVVYVGVDRTTTSTP